MNNDKSFTSKTVAIIGYGVEGQSAAEYFFKKGASITVCDLNEQLAQDDRFNFQLGENYLNNLGKFDLVIHSPSVRPELMKAASQVSSSTEYFLKNCPAMTIGVTGSKGKGTTSTLIQILLEAIGQKTWLGGNIGVPTLEFLDQVESQDAAVLEMSSFQLMDSNVSPNIAVCLMI